MIRIARGYDLLDPRDTAMFEDRRRLFVDMMRWDVPVRDDRFEIDQFDGVSAIYIQHTGDGAEHEGSMRLLPSTGSHILADLFAGLCIDQVPRGSETFEITRLCLPARLGAKRRLVVRNRLISAMVDHCLAIGVRTLTGVVRPAFRDAVLEMGWRARALGPTKDMGGMALGAFAISVDDETPARLAATGIYAPSAALAAVAA